MSRQSLSPKRLERRLREGAGGDEAGLRGALSLAAEADDQEFARELVRAIATRDIGRIAVDRKREIDEREATSPEVMSGADSSFLGRLSTTEADGERPGVADLQDVPTLLGILRAGTLPQRRAATERLAARLADGDMSNDEVRAVTTTLLSVRDVEIIFEVSHAREALPGAHGRQARQSTDGFGKVVDELVSQIDDFWAGQADHEPVSAMLPDERAQLMVRLRDTPDSVLHHLSAVLDGSDGVTDRAARIALVSSLRYSADPRVVPSLLGMLMGRAADLVPQAARALARIDDPRVHPALAAAYERSVRDAERAVLAGALGLQGDVRGRDYVRTLLGSDDDRVLEAAVEALEALATPEDCERLTPLLERSDPVLLAHVIRAMGRTGDPRGLLPLVELRRQSAMSALFADAEEAEASIRALLDLRGEEPPESTVAFELANATASGLAERSHDPMVVRMTSWLDFVTAHFWFFLGGVKRGIARLERAASRRPGWAAPSAALALHHAREERPAQALTAFRRALESDKGWVEKNVFAMRTMVRIFLRRAEEVEKSGRVDIARGLIEEVATLDLRRVPSELRFELSRRQEQLRARGMA